MTQLALDLDAKRQGGAEAAGGGGSDGGLGDACVLVRELDALGRQGLRRRVLVVRSMGAGRELLRQLARRGRSWVGFDLRTPLDLAERVVLEDGAEAVAERIDEFGEQRLLEQAIEDVLANDAGRRFRRLAGLKGKAGFRNAVRDSVKAVRCAGVSGRDAAKRVPGSDRVQFVAAVLSRFEELLEADGLSDDAVVLAQAASALEQRAGGRSEADTASQAEACYLAPGHPGAGLEGRFLRALRAQGARPLPAERVAGLPVPQGRRAMWAAAGAESPGSWLHDVERRPPLGHVEAGCSGPKSTSKGRAPRGHVEVFRAASVYDELRGVLRRAVARGARWDEVEIVTPNPKDYGSALHAIAEPLGIPVTFANGLPVQRTRPGRVVSAYFRWIDDEFAEPVIRALVEAGDVEAPGAGKKVGPRRLAEALRRLRIGYRRDRYEPAIRRALAGVNRMEPSRHESRERFERRKEQWILERNALRSLLVPVLKATPPTDGSEVSPAQVAAGVQSLLKRTSRGTDTDNAARDELEHRLNRIQEELTVPAADFEAAAAVVRGFLAVSVAPPGAEGSSQTSRTSAPGHLHISSLEGGGWSGRPHTFVAGMDSGSFPGPSFEGPLLSDRDRRRVGRGELGLEEEKAIEKRYLFAELFARLRGRISVSYACWDPSQARELAPAPEVLQALRLQRGDPALPFSALDGCVPLEFRVPRGGSAGGAMLDRDDVWLDAISAEDGRLLRASRAVGRGYPGVGRGMAAAAALERSEPSVHAGMLGTADPPFSFQNIFTRWDDAPRPLSAGALGHLGACPRRFLFRTVLRAYPPDDPEFDPDRWLNALERGAVLHRAYERTLKTAREKNIKPPAPEFMDVALERVRQECERALVETPCPSRAVQERETEELRADMRVFVKKIREGRPAWLHVEFPFGGREGMELEMGARKVLVRGAVDRVDEGDEGLRLVDYKTGKANTKMWDGPSGVYDGGRRLQHVVYAHAVHACLGQPVEHMEYQFPTRRGENQVRRYEAEELSRGGDLIAAMLEGVEAGCFPATDAAAKDCRFCDYREVCGVAGDWDGASCRHADWTARNLKEGGEAVARGGLSALNRARESDVETRFP